MRASIENPPLAAISGINIYTVYLLAWIIGGFLAGLSGGILSLISTGYNTVGMTLIVTFFAGSIVGGLYSVFGSLLGGLLIGLGEYIGIYLLSMYLGGWVTVYRPVIPLAIMVATLLIQPMGLAAIDWGKILRRVGLVRR
ncbi:MAG: ABC transporter permease subunit [Sulfolobales archaeon]